jgi:hypothetical protein
MASSVLSMVFWRAGLSEDFLVMEYERQADAVVPPFVMTATGDDGIEAVGPADHRRSRECHLLGRAEAESFEQLTRFAQYLFAQATGFRE